MEVGVLDMISKSLGEGNAKRLPTMGYQLCSQVSSRHNDSSPWRVLTSLALTSRIGCRMRICWSMCCRWVTVTSCSNPASCRCLLTRCTSTLMTKTSSSLSRSVFDHVTRTTLISFSTVMLSSIFQPKVPIHTGKFNGPQPIVTKALQMLNLQSTDMVMPWCYTTTKSVPCPSPPQKYVVTSPFAFILSCSSALYSWRHSLIPSFTSSIMSLQLLRSSNSTLE